MSDSTDNGKPTHFMMINIIGSKIRTTRIMNLDFFKSRYTRIVIGPTPEDVIAEARTIFPRISDDPPAMNSKIPMLHEDPKEVHVSADTLFQYILSPTRAVCMRVQTENKVTNENTCSLGLMEERRHWPYAVSLLSGIMVMKRFRTSPPVMLSAGLTMATMTFCAFHVDRMYRPSVEDLSKDLHDILDSVTKKEMEA